jgi:RNA polymerase primary sigma factor
MTQRDKRQEEIVENWEENDGVGTIMACTGFGKTRCALMEIKKMAGRDPSIAVLVIVPTIYLQNQWEERLKGRGLLQYVAVEVINTVVKDDFEMTNVDVLVLDEIHRYNSPVFSRVFEKIDYTYIMGLTATLPEGEKYNLTRERCPIFERVPLREALEHEWVAPFMVYNLGISLSYSETKQYDRLNEKYHKHFAAFNHNFGLAMDCLQNDRKAESYARQQNWDYNRVKMHAAQFIRNVQKRKKLLYNSATKVKAAKALIKRFSDRRIISFSQSISAANKIREYLPDRVVTYHSDMTGSEQDTAIENFRDEGNGYRVLSTSQALDQGADLPKIDMAIVVSGTSKPLQSIQRLGRTIRKDEDKRAVIVEIYARDTQDEKWLYKRQRKTPRETIRHTSSIDDILID